MDYSISLSGEDLALIGAALENSRLPFCQVRDLIKKMQDQINTQNQPVEPSENPDAEYIS